MFLLSFSVLIFQKKTVILHVDVKTNYDLRTILKCNFLLSNGRLLKNYYFRIITR